MMARSRDWSCRMQNDSSIRLVGAPASPYTRKMVALLRYRRIPYRITWGDPATTLDAMGIARPRPTLHPTFLFETADGEPEPMCDSTPIIRRLESACPGRSVLPEDPALAFVDYLIEDFGDEWCTKYMFHYRWHRDLDADNAGTLLPLAMDITMPDAAREQLKRAYSERQIGRLHVVGSNDSTAPVIEASYRRFLEAMEGLLARQPFALGKRPGCGDFGLFGQLTQLVGLDPSPRAIAHEVSPRTVAWVQRLEDLCGLEPQPSDWAAIDSLRGALGGLLCEIGRVYAPAMLANAAALARDEKSWEAEIDGALWTQKTFPYQAKCLRWLHEQYAALDDAAGERVDALLAGTGCEALLAA